MKFCIKCGKEITDDKLICSECEGTTEDVITEVAEDSTEDKKGKRKEKSKKIKDSLAKNGKDSVIRFTINKLLSAILTIVISAVTTIVVAPRPVEDDFKEYYKNVFHPMLDECKDIVGIMSENAGYIDRGEYGKFVEEYEDADLYERSKDLLVDAHSYASNNKDIMKLHNSYIGMIEEVYNISTCYYIHAKRGEKMGYDSQKIVLDLEARTAVHKQIRDELCKKYNIDPEEFKKNSLQ